MIAASLASTSAAVAGLGGSTRHHCHTTEGSLGLNDERPCQLQLVEGHLCCLHHQSSIAADVHILGLRQPLLQTEGRGS